MTGLAIPMWTSPLAMAADLDPTIVRTPALEVINSRVVEAFRTPDSKLLISMPPQEGKSTLLAKWLPVWALWLRRSLRMTYVSYEHGQARSVSAQARDTIVTYSDSLGLSINPELSAKHWWQIQDEIHQRNGRTRVVRGGGVYAVGIGGPLTGKPSDFMIIDDPFKGAEQADSLTYREAAQLWWQAVGSARLAPGAPVVVIQTRWHEDDLIGWLAKQTEGQKWETLNIPAQADHDPTKGETDILGREPGEYMISARGRTVEQWEQRRINAGARMWAAMYQGHPSPMAGGILKRTLWRYYDRPLWIERPDGSRWVPDLDEMIISVDATFKNTQTSDYVAIQVWMRRGVHVYLLDQIHGRMEFTDTTEALITISARWPQASLKVIEEAANGPAIMSALRDVVGGIVGEIPQGSKISRAYATTPYLEAGNVHLPSPLLELEDGSTFAWVADFVEEAAMFPNAKHDDRVDAYDQAINRLLIQPLMMPEATEPEDLETALADERGWSIMPY